MEPIKILFEVYDGKKGEKEHSRRYKAIGTSGVNSPISDVYIKRPYADKKDRVYITIEPKGD